MSVEILYTSASVNQKQRCFKTFTFNNVDFVSFCSHTAVCLARQQTENEGGAKIIYTFLGCCKPLSAIEIAVNSDQLFLVCGSIIGELNLFVFGKDLAESQSVNLLSDSCFPITSLSSVISLNTLDIMATIDDHFLFLSLNKSNTVESACSNFKTVVKDRLCICGKLMHVDKLTTLALIGLENGSLHLYKVDKSDQKAILLHVFYGHNDCITSIDIQTHDQFHLISTTSKDDYIRIWKLFSGTIPQEQQLAELTHFLCDDRQFALGLDSVCCNHENWVLSASFSPRNCDPAANAWYFLSCSMDCSTILWKQLKSADKDAPWLECKRFGTVGENALGLLDCAFSSNGDYFYVLGLRGNLSVWYHFESESWIEQPPLLGHFGSVTDLSWGRSLESKVNSQIKASESLPYLLTSSLDQTVRLHKQWHSPMGLITWHEMARPQIHGYDMNAVKSLNLDCYVSGGDEKVVRVFAGCSIDHGGLTENEEHAVAAKQPALGLSNFANPRISSNALIQTAKPEDETRLHLETLWPELKKLYGHSFEIYALDTHPKGTIVASACKSAKQSFADIILWNTSDWTILQRLVHHQLTVTCLRFSRMDGTHLLAGSRDRTWSVHAQQDYGYKLVAKSSTEGHKRIIWSCCWVPDNRCFLTGSRDTFIMLWGGIGEKIGIKLQEFRDLGEPVTALDAIGDDTVTNNYWVAVGVENGLISLLSLSLTEDLQANLTIHMHFDANKCHFSAPVKAIEFNGTEQGTLLASGGEDGIVRVFRLHMSL